MNRTEFDAALHAPWFRRTLDAWERRAPALRGHWERAVDAPLDAPAIAALRDALTAPRPGEDRGAAVARGLRQLRQVVLATLVARDASGRATLDEVCRAMSAFADLAVQSALDAAHAELSDRHGEPLDPEGRPVPLLVVGMGKLGAHELNVSSDIDLVYVARERGTTRGNTEGRNAIDTGEFLTRAARRVTQLLADLSEDGFVFRVDTRLRPDGDAGPLVCTLSMLENYFYLHGREWERFAWLKSRVVAATGGTDAPQAVEDTESLRQIVRPFVFRRYLDFGAFAAMRDLHGLIRAEARKREARRPGEIDVKLGRGGIREIEFSAQLFQVVRGGRYAELREPATLVTLAAIADRGLLPPEDCGALAAAYGFLRRVEHALQYREDAQTHVLPESPEVRAEVAGLLGMQADALLERLTATRAEVERCFDALLADTDPSRGPEEPAPSGPGTPITTRPDDAAENAAEDEAAMARRESRLGMLANDRLLALRASPRWRDARGDVRATIERLAERAVGQAAGLPDDEGQRALPRLFDLVEQIVGRPGYLALLDRYPTAFAHVLKMLGGAKWAADYLTRHPIVLDELLDGQVLAPTDWQEWTEATRRQLDALVDGNGPDVERQMDLLREAHHAQVFRLLAQDLDGRLTVERLSDHLSELADRVLEISVRTLWPQLRGRHRNTPAFAVIAYGRLGGKELGYASDLDLVYLYDDPDPQAAEVYARLAQKLSGWLSTNTAAGFLFEIDTRLRPNGNAGLLVSKLEAFGRYQRESAWVWEHQALTRARFAAGDADVGARFETLRRELLSMPRDPAKLATEVVAMRRKMHDGHPNRSEAFDLKHDEGGMVDIEFIVQYLVLAHARAHPELLDNAGNIALLGRIGQAGLVEEGLARDAADAYRRYRGLQHALRLNDARFVRVPPMDVDAERATVRALWKAVFGEAGH